MLTQKISTVPYLYSSLLNNKKVSIAARTQSLFQEKSWLRKIIHTHCDKLQNKRNILYN